MIFIATTVKLRKENQVKKTKTVCYYMSRTRFRVNLHSVFTSMSRIPCLKQARYLKLSDSNGIRIHYHLVRKKHSTSLAKWLSVRLRTKRLWVRIPVLSLKKTKYGSNISNKNYMYFWINGKGSLQLYKWTVKMFWI